MKKRIFGLALALAVMLVIPASMQVSKAEQPKEQSYTVRAEKSETSVLTEKGNFSEGVLKARFENMLSLNYLYGDDFELDRTVIENSILALLEHVKDGQIDKALVLNFVANMYGREVDPAAAEYEFAPADEGKFTVIPRGYSEYSHYITSVSEEEGGYTVLSKMAINPHDGEVEVVTVKTVFAENAGSSYGYNIVSSDII